MTKELTDAEKKELAQRIARSVERAPFRDKFFDLKCFSLPFYNNAYDVHVKCFTTRPVITKEYICDDARVFETDGEEETLAEINKALNLKLTADNAAAYVAFYFQKVAVGDGFARLIFSAKDVTDDGFNEELAENLKALIAAPGIRPVSDGFAVSGFVLSGETLFKAQMSLRPDGTLSIDEEEIVYDDLPVRRVMLR